MDAALPSPRRRQRSGLLEAAAALGDEEQEKRSSPLGTRRGGGGDKMTIGDSAMREGGPVRDPLEKLREAVLNRNSQDEWSVGEREESRGVTH
ncbi:hypothetical protein MTO96_037570 [Rhipicephalus appendiculatus]